MGLLHNIYRLLPMGKPTGNHENNKLECPWVEEFMGNSNSSTYVEAIYSSDGFLNGNQIGWKIDGKSKNSMWLPKWN